MAALQGELPTKRRSPTSWRSCAREPRASPREEESVAHIRHIPHYLPRASARSISLYCCCNRVFRFSGTGYLLPYDA